MYQFVRYFNFFVFVLFFLCYFYQIAYIFVRFFKKAKKEDAKTFHKYAVVISARNEEAVIGELLTSISQQNYPRELLDVYVIADNCTDDTAAIAREHGANVLERFNYNEVGKGYSLDYAFARIEEERGILSYEGYLVFDADNVLDENFLYEINKVFDKGYSVVTSYRNSKNYDSNWLSAGYALWFLRESKYLNGARMLCNTSCAISGTGFLVSSALIHRNQGWKYHLLTEDIEFSVDNVIKGEKIGYCEEAILYDEQPVRFKDSWRQRLRWTKGFYQVFFCYGGGLLNGVVSRGSFQCYDMMMTIAPATILTLSTIVFNVLVMACGVMEHRPLLVQASIVDLGYTALGLYGSLFLFGLVTTVTEWRQIHCVGYKKVLYLFTFPIFILTYIPIAIAAIFKKVTWEPINHSIIKSVQQIRQ